MVSRLRLIEIIVRMLPTETVVDRFGRRLTCRLPIAGLTTQQISWAIHPQADSGGAVDTMLGTLAEHFGWRKLDEETYIERRSA